MQLIFKKFNNTFKVKIKNFQILRSLNNQKQFKKKYLINYRKCLSKTTPNLLGSPVIINIL